MTPAATPEAKSFFNTTILPCSASQTAEPEPGFPTFFVKPPSENLHNIDDAGDDDDD
jgi:hypothetical protein